jgi:hypothetical protein
VDDSLNHPIDCGLATTGQFARQFTKQTIAQRSADLSYERVSRVTDPVSPTSTQYGDLNVIRYDEGQSVSDYRVAVSPLETKTAFVKSAQSSNPAALINSDANKLFFSFVGNGETVITTELTNGEQYAQLLKAETYTQYQYDAFQSFVDGTLIKAINDSTVALLNNSTAPLGHYPYYSTYNVSTATYARNPQCWIGGLDLSGLCVATAGGNTRMCAMVAPQFAVGIRHAFFHPKVGESVVFCTPQNETITRIVESVSYLFSDPPQNLFYRDFSLIKFTQPVPDSITKYKLFPSNAEDYFPLNWTYNRIVNANLPPVAESYSMRYCPVVGVSHYRWDTEYQLQRSNRFAYLAEVVIGNLGEATPTFISEQSISFDPHPSYPNYNGKSSWFRGGDSGGPVFAVLNGDLILLGSLISEHWIKHVGSFVDQIQAKIDEVGPADQTVQTVNLSAFTNFAS